MRGTIPKTISSTLKLENSKNKIEKYLKIKINLLKWKFVG
jgi:hypothetical protein